MFFGGSVCARVSLCLACVSVGMGPVGTVLPMARLFSGHWKVPPVSAAFRASKSCGDTWLLGLLSRMVSAFTPGLLWVLFDHEWSS